MRIPRQCVLKISMSNTISIMLYYQARTPKYGLPHNGRIFAVSKRTSLKEALKEARDKLDIFVSTWGITEFYDECDVEMYL